MPEDRSVLRARIGLRANQMLAQGLIEEVMPF
jgi:tRNA A37 N6-isopentenylltransferase MiaA